MRKRQLRDIWGRGFDYPLANHELRSLDKNSALFLKVPFLERDGTPHPTKRITLNVKPQDVNGGRVYYGWNGKRIIPKKRGGL